MAGVWVLDANLTHFHVTRPELRSRLRQAGIRHRGEVAAVVFGRCGTISVLRRGELIDPAFLQGVRAGDLCPPGLLLAQYTAGCPSPLLFAAPPSRTHAP